jgi:ceramide glucosyltransferase
MTFWLSVLLAASTAWTLLGLFAVMRVVRRRARASAGAPPVTVLKPLCGADACLGANLESFFRLDYPDFELLFGVDDPDDAAIAVVRMLMHRYPAVRAKLVVHRETARTPLKSSLNPKVDNLRRMVPHAGHDLLLVSDSNVRAPESYLRDVVATFFADGERPAGLVTNLFAGAGENTLGSALENVQLTGFCAAGVALPTVCGDPAVVGKSMFFSRAAFEAVGGFERVADVLAEDFVIGKLFHHAGYDVRLAPTRLETITSGLTVRAFLARHERWAMLRWRLRPAPFMLEPLASPYLLIPAALAVLGPSGIVWAVALTALRDAGGWVALRGPRRAWIPLVCSPLREVAMLYVWLRAPHKRHVSWRGHRVRLGAGTLLYAAPENTRKAA